MRLSLNKSLSWEIIDQQLWLCSFTVSSTQLEEEFSLSSHGPHAVVDRGTQQLCHNFNKGKPCTAVPCQYRHICNRENCLGQPPASSVQGQLVQKVDPHPGKATSLVDPNKEKLSTQSQQAAHNNHCDPDINNHLNFNPSSNSQVVTPINVDTVFPLFIYRDGVKAFLLHLRNLSRMKVTPQAKSKSLN